MPFSLDTVRTVARLLHESDLVEISLEAAKGSQLARLTVRRSPAPSPHRETVAATTPASQAAATTPSVETTAPVATAIEEPAEAGPQRLAVTATAVGLFRHERPALQVGDKVRHGQVIGSVESLKVPNEVTAPVAGRVVEIPVEEGQGVEYSQPLMVLESE